MKSWIRERLPHFLTKGRIRVRSGPLADGYSSWNGSSQTYHSRFNPAWIDELGLPAPRTIIDAGAYDGGDTLRYAHHFPGSRVLAIEADSSRAAIVRSNVESTPQISVIECAVQDKDGKADWNPLFRDGQPGAAGSIFPMDQLPRGYSRGPATSVTGRTLRSICEEHDIRQIDLLHMDIQGAEYAALAGLGPMRPSLIYLEVGEPYRGAATTENVHRLLQRMGYALAAVRHKDRLYVHVKKRGSF